jgi:transcriptional regulator with XRE-family HTH domain
MKTIKAALGEYLKRADHGAITDLAKEVGISRQALFKIKKGETKRPKDSTMHGLAEALQRRGYLEIPSSPTEEDSDPKSLAQQQDEAFLSLAGSLESLVSELRDPRISRGRKVRRVKFELEQVAEFLGEFVREEGN